MVIVDGKRQPKSQDTLTRFTLPQDSLLHERLLATIREKNRLYRSRLQPLNEAYIYLFRRHEMGHLAYEMDDLDQLVAEKEREIERLLAHRHSYDIEIELIRPWQPPKDYPEDEVPGREPNDRIVILEDTDGDGRADKHTVFAENLLIPHSVVPVAGGAYVTASTELLFLADTDGDDVADSRRVVFDGFGNADVHHTIHGLRWAPWGDLYFTQSIYINSFVETAYGPRVLNGSGIWTFRPETEALDIFSRGLINPWGYAVDEWGQTFATDGAGSSGINYLFPESAHATAVGADRVLPGLNSGTPKNTAAEVVYSQHFPQEWQGSIITNDFRANRTVRYRVWPYESGYAAEEVQTILRSDHHSYRPVDTKIGPEFFARVSARPQQGHQTGLRDRAGHPQERRNTEWFAAPENEYGHALAPAGRPDRFHSQPEDRKDRRQPGIAEADRPIYRQDAGVRGGLRRGEGLDVFLQLREIGGQLRRHIFGTAWRQSFDQDRYVGIGRLQNIDDAVDVCDRLRVRQPRQRIVPTRRSTN